MVSDDLSLSFDDVLLAPLYSEVRSRSEIDVSASLGNISFELPVISSPMDTVTEVSMSIAMAEHGGLGVVHRYNTIAEQVAAATAALKSVNRVSAAVGVSGDFVERAQALSDVGVGILCVDVAHGHHVLVRQALAKLRTVLGDSAHIMAGNVATLSAFNDLADWGADSIRVDIGGGSICSTRIQTGHGVPTFQSILDCARSDRDVALIADGGIRTSGDIVKAIAAGANFVMLGSMLAGTTESPGQVFTDNAGKSYKVYRGMASVEAQRAWRGEARSLEGVSTTIPFKGPVSSVLLDLDKGMRSGFSYSGALNQVSLQSKAKFITQTQAGTIEGRTHINNK